MDFYNLNHFKVIVNLARKSNILNYTDIAQKILDLEKHISGLYFVVYNKKVTLQNNGKYSKRFKKINNFSKRLKKLDRKIDKYVKIISSYLKDLGYKDNEFRFCFEGENFNYLFIMDEQGKEIEIHF